MARETEARRESVPRPAPAAPVPPGRQVDLRRALRVGLLGAAAAVFVSAIGMVEAFAERQIIDGLGLGYLILALIPVGFGYLAGRPPAQFEGYAPPRAGLRNVLAGLLAGLAIAVLASVFVALVRTFNVRPVFTNVSPALVELLTFHRGLGVGLAFLLPGITALAGVGGALHLIPRRWRRALVVATAWVLLAGLVQSLVLQVLVGLDDLIPGLDVSLVGEFLYQPAGGLTVFGAAALEVGVFGIAVLVGRSRRRAGLRRRFVGLPRQRRAILGLVILVLLFGAVGVLPWIFGPFLSEVANVAGIFLLMALGLNIVVGFAGLLDLGYVAFFAVGSYTTAVLTSPTSPAFSPELTFWLALPFVMMAAAVAGITVGTPVLRMRGDYLAIVTLGFGEIARILFLSDWLSPVFGGPRGIRQIPNIVVGGAELSRPPELFYPIFGFVLIALYASYALRDSRMGRAWMAIREDESVAEAMGVDIVSAKLWAFVIGAGLASFGGALFAMKVGSVFPSTFEIIVSVTVLVVIIVGGLESIVGVTVGAFLLIALPEILREFDEYRFLLYGALLIFMMIKRPEGLIPSRRRAEELHEEARVQDAWPRAGVGRQEQEPQPARDSG
jgi:branched-chain amino acid transport system permease protein